MCSTLTTVMPSHSAKHDIPEEPDALIYLAGAVKQASAHACEGLLLLLLLLLLLPHDPLVVWWASEGPCS